ncbi:MAG TPA: DUF1559 domain-containing protein [Planctomycetaceae bacterium]|nr:DUF1559 domain-containing protein [Planctomycetaceae bacterium]
MPARSRLTLLELAVVCAIVALVFALLAPGVQQSREAARRVQCQSNLRQIGMAIHAYESAWTYLPPGNIRNSFGWLALILPYLNRSDLYQKIDFNRVEFSDQDPIARTIIPSYLCPSESAPAIGRNGNARTSYPGNMGRGCLDGGYNGIFNQFCSPPDSPYRATLHRLADVTDGTAQTAMMSEFLIGNYTGELLRVNWHIEQSQSSIQELKSACLDATSKFLKSGSPWGDPTAKGSAWIEGQAGMTWYTHSLPPFRRSCFNGTGVQTGVYTAASAHDELVHVLFVDGSVQPFGKGVDERVWRALGSRNGGESEKNTP